MSTLSNGNPSSASYLNASFASIQQQGTDILSILTQMELDTLVNFDRRLTELSSKQQRAARVQAPGIAALFVVSDFGSIDQGQTTATLRVDTATATLRERHVPTSALITSTSFTASSGTVSALNADATLLSVFSKTVPTGTFTMQLQQSVGLSFLSLDLAAMSSTPEISVKVSPDGLVYTPASDVSLNGSVLNAWFPETKVLYIQVSLTPSQPDNLGGNTYTFGITGFSATTVSYNLVSGIVFRPAQIVPRSANLLLHVEGSGSLVYNLLLGDVSSGASYTEVMEGSIIPIPGVNAFTNANTSIDSSGVLAVALPINNYPNSIKVRNTTLGIDIPVVVGLSPTDPHIASLQQVCACVNGANITITPHPSSITDKYTVSCLTGPPAINATLLVHLSTSDKTQTPVFKGASLEDQ